MITAAQIRAGRALLRWAQTDLARASLRGFSGRSCGLARERELDSFRSLKLR
jgi:hypothetical protein